MNNHSNHHCTLCHKPTPTPQNTLCPDCNNRYEWTLTDYPTTLQEALAALQPTTTTKLKEHIKGGKPNHEPLNTNLADKILQHLRWFYTATAELAPTPEIINLCTTGWAETKLIDQAATKHQQLTTTICTKLKQTPTLPTKHKHFPDFVKEAWKQLHQLQKLAPKPAIRVLKQRGRQCPICFKQHVLATFQPDGIPIVACKTCGHQINIPAKYLTNPEQEANG